MPLTYSRCQMSSNVPFLHPKARPYTSQQPSCRILLQYQPEVPHPLIGMTHGLGLAAQKGTGSPLQAVYFIPICLLLNWGSYKSKQHGVGLRAACGNHGQHQSQQLHVTLTRKASTAPALQRASSPARPD